MPSLLGLPCARARPPRPAACGPGQPVPGSCPASPSAAAGLAVPPAITLQSLRGRHRHQFCSPQPLQPSLPHPRLQCLQSSCTSLLQRMQRQHHVRGRADWRTCMPSHAPHSPPAWIDQLTAPPAPTTACRVMKHEIDIESMNHRKGLVSKKKARATRAPPLLRSNT